MVSSPSTPALSGERIQEIKGRLEAATPGPWRGMHFAGYVYANDRASSVVVTRCGDFAMGHDMATSYQRWNADTALIANAPSDIADLLAECERLRALHREDTPEAWNVEWAIDHSGKVQPVAIGPSIREAIDAARKQEGEI